MSSAWHSFLIPVRNSELQFAYVDSFQDYVKSLEVENETSQIVRGEWHLMTFLLGDSLCE
jgi:hypothetical protein